MTTAPHRTRTRVLDALRLAPATTIDLQKMLALRTSTAEKAVRGLSISNQIQPVGFSARRMCSKKRAGAIVWALRRHIAS